MVITITNRKNFRKIKLYSLGVRETQLELKAFENVLSCRPLFPMPLPPHHYPDNRLLYILMFSPDVLSIPH